MNYFFSNIIEIILIHTNQEISIHRQNHKNCNDGTLQDVRVEELEAVLNTIINCFRFAGKTNRVKHKEANKLPLFSDICFVFYSFL